MKRLLHALLATAAIAASPTATSQTIEWTRTFTGNPGGWATVGCTFFDDPAPQAIATFPNGDVAVVGCVRNGNGIVTTRYDGTTGAVAWTVTHSGYIIDPSEPETGVALMIDAQGDVIIAGNLDSYGTSRVDLVTTKYAGATGAVVWTSTHGHVSNSYEQAWAIAADAAGDIFVTGQTKSSSFSDTASPFTVKVNGQTGALQWKHVGPLGSYDHGTAIVVDAAGDAYVAARLGDAFGVYKLAGTNGAAGWTYAIANQGEARSIALLPSGDVAVAGGSGQTWYVVRLSASTGVATWARALGSNSFTRMGAVVRVDGAGDVVAVGSASAGAQAVKLAGATGATLWGVALDPGSTTEPGALALDAQGNLAVVATDYPLMRVMRFRASDGLRLWAQDYDAGPSGRSIGVGVAIGASGDVIAAGDSRSQPSIFSTDYRIAKHAAADGALRWSAAAPALPGYAVLTGRNASRVVAGRIAILSQVSESFASSTDRLDVVDAASGVILRTVDTGTKNSYAGIAGTSRVELDAAGNAYVTGAGPNFGGGVRTARFDLSTGLAAWTATTTAAGDGGAIALGADGSVAIVGKSDTAWVVARYSAGGAPIWERSLPNMGPFSGYHETNAIAIDSAGDVIVVGRSTTMDMTAQSGRTIKLAAANGATVWDRSLPGSMNFALAIGANDDVAVGGISNSYPNTYFQTTMYSSGGTQQWSNLYSGQSGNLNAIAIDSQGAVVVTGSSSADPFGAPSVRTIKYDGSGQLLWNVATDKPAGGTAIGRDVAIDPAGDVVLGIVWYEAGQRPVAHVTKLDGASGAPSWGSHVVLPQPDGNNLDYVVVRIAGDGAILVASDIWRSNQAFTTALTRIVTTRAPSASDFDGNGQSDVLFANADGRAAIWLMNGLAPTATQEIIGAATGWSVRRLGDFDGDGKTDLVWQHTDGRMAIYLMNGTVPAATQQLLNAGSGWSVTHTPDLDGDGKADLLFQNTDGSVAVWTMNGTAMTAGASIIGPGTGWSVTHVGDFDGDGKDDLVWKHTNGRHAIWLMNGTAIAATNQILNAATGWTVAQVADLDGDGKSDLVWQNTDGSIAAWLMNGAAMASGSGILGAGSGFSVTRTGDFNGDGKADLFFLHTDGRAAIWLMNGLVPTTTTQILNAGGGWSAARVQDLDGDGKADIVWQNADGSVALWLMDGTAMTSGSGILGPGTGWGVSPASP